jgi:hypothetical protein
LSSSPSLNIYPRNSLVSAGRNHEIVALKWLRNRSLLDSQHDMTLIIHFSFCRRFLSKYAFPVFSVLVAVEFFAIYLYSGLVSRLGNKLWNTLRIFSLLGHTYEILYKLCLLLQIYLYWVVFKILSVITSPTYSYIFVVMFLDFIFWSLRGQPFYSMYQILFKIYLVFAGGVSFVWY